MPEVLWAPWRMTYVEKPTTGKPGGDIFTDLPAQDRDVENLILQRGKTAFVMLNAYPYASGHLLVAPYRCVPEIDQLNDEELLEINQICARCVRWLRTTYQPNGFNLGVNMGRAAGAGIPVHIHWHIVPRWDGDTNYMTVTAGVKVMPESLAQTYQRLQKAMQNDA